MFYLWNVKTLGGATRKCKKKPKNTGREDENQKGQAGHG